MPTASVSIAGSTPFGVQVFTLVVEQGLGKRAKRARGELWIDTVGHPVSKPLTGQTINISIEGIQEFAGVLITVTDEWINPVVYKVAFEAMDYSLQLDSHLVTKEYDEQLLSARVQAVLTTYAPAFTIGTIDNDETIPDQTIDHREPSAVFDELAELTNQYFELKFDRTVNFLQAGDTAPVTSIVIEDANNVSDFVVTEDWSDLHNVAIIKDFTMRSAYTIDDEHVADGVQSFFGLTYPPWSVEETLVEVKKGTGWTSRTSKIDPLGTQRQYELTGEETEAERIQKLINLEVEKQEILNGNPGEAYICIWNEGVRFPLSDLPAEGELVRIRYPFERREQVLESRDLTSIGVMAAREGTDGIHEKVINLPELRAVSLESATDYAEMLLARGAWPSIAGSFKTYVTGWAPGQKFTLSSTVREVEDPHPGGGPLDAWVSNVVKRIIATDPDGTYKVEHEIQFTNQPQAVPIPLDEFLHRLMDQTTHINPPGSVYTTSTSTTTTLTSTSTSISGTSTSTSTTTTLLTRAILLEVATPG